MFNSHDADALASWLVEDGAGQMWWANDDGKTRN